MPMMPFYRDSKAWGGFSHLNNAEIRDDVYWKTFSLMHMCSWKMTENFDFSFFLHKHNCWETFFFKKNVQMREEEAQKGNIVVENR